VTRSLGVAMSALGRLSTLDVMLFAMQRQQATHAEDRRELECGAKLAKQKEDEARKEKQTAAAAAVLQNSRCPHQCVAFPILMLFDGPGHVWPI